MTTSDRIVHDVYRLILLNEISTHKSLFLLIITI